MKKTFYVVALAAGMMTFASCNTTTEERNEDRVEEVEDGVENAGDELEEGADEIGDEAEEAADNVKD